MTSKRMAVRIDSSRSAAASARRADSKAERSALPSCAMVASVGGSETASAIVHALMRVKSGWPDTYGLGCVGSWRGLAHSAGARTRARAGGEDGTAARADVYAGAAHH
jgi:hypothetical protein